jgi:hypothetical protein
MRLALKVVLIDTAVKYIIYLPIASVLALRAMVHEIILFPSTSDA